MLPEKRTVPPVGFMSCMMDFPAVLVAHLFVLLGPRHLGLKRAYALCDYLADHHLRVERRVRVLKDYLRIRPKGRKLLLR